MEIFLPGSKLHALTDRKLTKRMMRTRKTKIQDLARIMGIIVAAHPAILPTLINYRHQSGKGKNTGSEEGPQLRIGCRDHSRDEDRASVVGRRIIQAQWSTFTSHSMGPDHRVRCIDDGRLLREDIGRLRKRYTVSTT